jgi:hypothetical protein
VSSVRHLSSEVPVSVRRQTLSFPSLPHWLDYSGNVFFSGANAGGADMRELKVVGYTEKLWPDSVDPPTIMMCYLAGHKAGMTPSPGDSGGPVFKTEASGTRVLHSFIRAKGTSGSVSERKEYYLLTPAHFLLEQLQSMTPFADAGEEAISSMQFCEPKLV